jgi:hypothetical protein
MTSTCWCVQKICRRRQRRWRARDSPLPRSALVRACELRFDHESGLPVELHDRLYRSPFYDGDLARPWSRAREGKIVGVPVRLMGDADLLVHALVHASVVPQRCGLSWIVDTVSLLQKRASENAAFDWPAVTWIARDAEATLPLYVMCRYLATTFNASIPEHVMGALRCSAANAGPLQHLAALDGLRSEPRHRRIKVLAQASGWRSRRRSPKRCCCPRRHISRESIRASARCRWRCSI